MLVSRFEFSLSTILPPLNGPDWGVINNKHSTDVESTKRVPARAECKSCSDLCPSACAQRPRHLDGQFARPGWMFQVDLIGIGAVAVSLIITLLVLITYFASEMENAEVTGDEVDVERGVECECRLIKKYVPARTNLTASGSGTNNETSLVKMYAPGPVTASKPPATVTVTTSKAAATNTECGLLKMCAPALATACSKTAHKTASKTNTEGAPAPASVTACRAAGTAPAPTTASSTPADTNTASAASAASAGTALGDVSQAAGIDTALLSLCAPAPAPASVTACKAATYTAAATASTSSATPITSSNTTPVTASKAAATHTEFHTIYDMAAEMKQSRYVPEAGAHTHPLLTSTGAVSDTKYTIKNPLMPPATPTQPLNTPSVLPESPPKYPLSQNRCLR